MKLYNVSFEKSGIFQTNLVKTEKSPVEVELYYRDIKKAEHVYSVDFASDDNLRPGKPVIQF